MESTSKQLADAIGRDLEWLAAGLARWLAAAGYPLGATPCRAILCELRSWLRREGGSKGARQLLGGRRARELAHSFVNDNLKHGVEPARAVDALLHRFFAVGAPVATNRRKAAAARRGPMNVRSDGA